FVEQIRHPRWVENSHGQHGCATIDDDRRGLGHSPGHYRNLDLLFRPFFGTGDGAFLAQAASAPPPGGAQSWTHQIRTGLSGKPAPHSEPPAFGRRPGERSAGDFVSGPLVGRPVCVTHSTVAGRNCDLRDRKSTRLNSSHEWISYAVFCLKK